MKRVALSLYIALFFLMLRHSLYAAEKWKFQKTYETGKLADRRISLYTTGELKRNGEKELIVGYLDPYLDVSVSDERDEKSDFNFYLFEWENNDLMPKFSKKWKYQDEQYYAVDMKIWDVEGRTIGESFPPYFAIEWQNGQYNFMEQKKGEHLLGSWIFPWQSTNCSEFAKDQWPRECLYGIRDFGGNGELKLITLTSLTKERSRSNDILKVRSSEPPFPVEFEHKSSETDFWRGTIDYGRFSKDARQGILLRNSLDQNLSMLKYDEKTKNYKIIKTKIKDFGIKYEGILSNRYIISSTRNKGIEEYWGYTQVNLKDGGFTNTLVRVELKPDLSGIIKKEINFQRHKLFIGVGHFDVTDIDGDGLDEVIFLEETGKRVFGEETTDYRKYKGYIKILKWNGKEYEVMWESPAYTERGTTFLVEDIKGTGKKQIVVFTPERTIQIWERE
ncbi:MAG: hypothetical protein HZC48_13740 [Nitrospirae bacterium]|nr:hypothetical protein [Nitrospirota bacterium]